VGAGQERERRGDGVLHVGEVVDGDLDGRLVQGQQVGHRGDRVVVGPGRPEEVLVGALDPGGHRPGADQADVLPARGQLANGPHDGGPALVVQWTGGQEAPVADHDRAVLGDEGHPGRGPGEGVPQGGVLASARRDECDAPGGEALEEGPQTLGDPPFAVEQGAVHVGDDESDVRAVGQFVGLVHVPDCA